MAPRQRIDIDVQREIERLALSGWGAAQIEHDIRERDDELSARLPTLRTIQRIVKALTPEDTSDTWTLLESEPEHIGAVLEVLAAMVRWTGGQKTSFTKAEARWIIAVRNAASDLPPREVYTLGKLYLLREGQKRTSPDLDALLAFAPWRGSGAMSLYREAVTTRQVFWPRVFWAMSHPYNRLLHDMGFHDSLINEADGNYQRLLGLMRRLETTGSVDLGEEGGE